MTACPDWCQDGACKGEHTASVAREVPATAGLPMGSVYGGYVFPGVRVILGHDEVDHLQPCVTVHLVGEHHDADADMHVHEVKQLIETLQLAVDVLEGRARLKAVDAQEVWIAPVEAYRGEVMA